MVAADSAAGAADHDQIARLLFTMIAQPNGVVHSFVRRQRTSGRKVDPRYGCLLDSYEAMSAYDTARRSRVRSCLEQATAADPNFMLGFVSLAEVNIREYLAMADSAGATLWLDRALADTRRAIELHPNSARAHGMLMWALFVHRNVVAAVAEGSRAVAVNPYDMLIKADVGAITLKSGQIEEGYALLKTAAASWPDRPPRVSFSLFSGAYLTGDFVTANRYAQAIMTDKYHSALFARALAAAKMGDMPLARRTLERLYLDHPAWAANPRRAIGKLFASGEIVERLAADLESIASATH
jgi:tetratricopeptide (TPR) repeat protein